MKKKNIFSSSSYQWVDIFVNLLGDRKPVDSTRKYYLLAGDKNQVSFFSLCKLVEIMYILTPTLKNVGKTEGI